MGAAIQMPADLAPDVAAKVGPTAAPARVANGGGDCAHPGARAANEVQGRWFTDVTTRVILPKFKEAGKPFFLVFWSRDPDGTQHNNGDSFGKLTPGINGETSLRAITNADDSLRQIRRTLRQLGLEATTDIIKMHVAPEDAGTTKQHAEVYHEEFRDNRNSDGSDQSLS
jgi:hypothetical protein